MAYPADRNDSVSTPVALVWLLVGANFTGAVVTFCYLTFVDLATRGESRDTTLDNVLFFPIGFAIVMVLAIWIGARWRVPAPVPTSTSKTPRSGGVRSRCHAEWPRSPQ